MGAVREKLTCLLIMSVKAWGGGLKALADMSIKNVSFLDGSPYIIFIYYRYRILKSSKNFCIGFADQRYKVLSPGAFLIDKLSTLLKIVSTSHTTDKIFVDNPTSGYMDFCCCLSDNSEMKF